MARVCRRRRRNTPPAARKVLRPIVKPENTRIVSNDSVRMNSRLIAACVKIATPGVPRRLIVLRKRNVG